MRLKQPNRRLKAHLMFTEDHKSKYTVYSSAGKPLFSIVNLDTDPAKLLPRVRKFCLQELEQ